MALVVCEPDFGLRGADSAFPTSSSHGGFEAADGTVVVAPRVAVAIEVAPCEFVFQVAEVTGSPRSSRLVLLAGFRPRRHLDGLVEVGGLEGFGALDVFVGEATMSTNWSSFAPSGSTM